MPLRASRRNLEGVLQNPVDADARHHRFLQHHLPVGALEQPPAGVGVFALGVLAHHDEIDVTRSTVGQWAFHTGHEFHRPQVDVLVEAAPKLQQAAPQRDVVGHDVGPPDRPEEDRVESLEHTEPVRRQHRPVPRVVVRRCEIEMLVGEPEVERRGRRVEHPQPLGHDLGADPVAGDDRDAIGPCHAEHPVSSAR